MSFEIYKVPLDHFSFDQLDTILRSWVQGHGQKMIVTPNPEILLKARRDESFLLLLQDADMSIPDGVGLRFAAAALTDRKMQFRHTGVDTLEHLAQLSEDYGKTMLLFGGTDDVAVKTARSLRASYKSLDVAALNPGEILVGDSGLELDPDILLELQKLKPTVLAVALGAGKQEQFMAQYLEKLPSVKVAIGIGGAFDMMSGELQRAPVWMRRSGLEWMWRVVKEPKRFKRIWNASVVFPSLVAYDSLRQGRLHKAVINVTPEVFKQLLGR